ncbi:MAG TPA: hypothetical protein VLJ60_06790, partial [bacterium]|nr:hypothetical protein [bacterium]
MKHFLKAFAFLLFLTGAQSLAAERIVVWNLSPQSGVTEKESSTVTAILIGEIARISKMDVISEKEIKSAIMTEETRKSCIADDNSCIAEIGAALGSPYSVTGTISRMGGYWVVSIQLLDVQKVEVKSRVSKKFKGSESKLLESVTPLVCELFNDTVCLNELKAEKPTVWRKAAGWTFFTLGTATLIFGGVSNGLMNKEKENYLNDGSGNESTYKKWKGAAITGYVAGSVFLATGLTFLIMERASEKKKKKEK